MKHIRRLIFCLIIVGLIIFLWAVALESSAAYPDLEFNELDLPEVSYLNYDEIFRAQGAFENAYSLPKISFNLAKMIGFHSQNDSSVQLYSDHFTFSSSEKGGSVVIDFSELPPGEYYLRYYNEMLGDNWYTAFGFRLSEDEPWRLEATNWKNPLYLSVEEGDRLQVRLYNHNGERHYYNIWFHIAPIDVDIASETPAVLKEIPYFNHIGKVYHVGKKYYQVVDEFYSSYYNDFSALEDLGECIVTPDVDFSKYKIYKTAGDRWRILWRGDDVYTNPLIYENGFFYVEEPSGAYYSVETYESFSHALVALTSTETEYAYDAIRRYKDAFTQDAIEFFDPFNNDLFWNVYVEDVYPATFYWHLNNSHYNELFNAYGDLDRYHWSLPSVFSFQNYTEECTAYPIELRAKMTRGFSEDIGSFFYDRYNNVTEFISSTGTKLYCEAEEAYLEAKSFFENGKEYIVDSVSSFWSGAADGFSTYYTEIKSGNNTFTNAKDFVMGIVYDSLGAAWLDEIRNVVVPSNDPFRELLLFFRDKFSFITDLRAIIERIVSVFNKNSRAIDHPPVIYADFSESDSQAFQGVGQVVVADFSWYARYKPYVDTFLSAILWGFFMFRLYFRLPDIINGAGSFFDAAQDAPTVPSKGKKIGFS